MENEKNGVRNKVGGAGNEKHGVGNKVGGAENETNGVGYKVMLWKMKRTCRKFG